MFRLMNVFYLMKVKTKLKDGYHKTYEYEKKNIIIPGYPEEIEVIRNFKQKNNLTYKQLMFFGMELWKRADINERKSVAMKVKAGLRNKSFDFSTEPVPLIIRKNGSTIQRLKNPFMIVSYVQEQLQRYLDGKGSSLFNEDDDIKNIRMRILEEFRIER